MFINKKIKLALIGMLLGDANLQKISERLTARLRVNHSVKQYDYVQHKYTMFKEIIRTGILHSIEIRESGKTYHKRYFHTLTVPELHFYFQMFYPNRVKVVPTNIHRYLKEPIVLAYWYMDDGALKWRNRSKGVRICTDNFTREEVCLLAQTLNNIYGWNVTVHRQRSRFRLYIPNKDYEFSLFVFPHILKSLQYKVPMPLKKKGPIFNATN